MSQFVVTSYLNEHRSLNFMTYNSEHSTTNEKIDSWIAHKFWVTISFPANLLAAGIGSLSAITGASTIGAFKVAVFAITLGNVTPRISTGVLWNGQRVIAAVGGIASTVGELCSDIQSFASKCVEFVQTAIRAIGLQALLEKIQDVCIQVLEFIGRHLSKVFNFIGERFKKGFKEAIDSETNYQLGDKDLPVIDEINRQREKFSNYPDSINHRSFKHIAIHTTLSILTLPVNALALACSTAVSCILAGAFFSKILLFAATNINIPIPTLVTIPFEASLRVAGHLLKNIYVSLLDVPITLYKVSELTGIYRVMVTIKDVVAYIPRAIFEQFDQDGRTISSSTKMRLQKVEA